MNIVLKGVFSSLIVVLLCGGCTNRTNFVKEEPTSKGSHASALAENEFEFQRAKEEGDALGMARAARNRVDFLEFIELFNDGKLDATGYSKRRDLERAITYAARSMLDEAVLAAHGDDALIASIDRMFPGERPSHSGSNLSSGIKGILRKAEVTIGLEIEVTLIPNEPYVMRLPADRATGTTIYVQPIGVYQNTLMDITMEVTPVSDGLAASPPACSVSAVHGRLPCFVSPGNYSNVELRVVNHGSYAVYVLIFVSGNEDSVRTVLEPK